jgi:hypothetical protein
VLNSKPEELDIFRRLALEGFAKACNEAADILDRGWCHRLDDGTLRLTRDGAEVARMAGLAHDGDAAGDAQPTSAAPRRVA